MFRKECEMITSKTGSPTLWINDKICWIIRRSVPSQNCNVWTHTKTHHIPSIIIVNKFDGKSLERKPMRATHNQYAAIESDTKQCGKKIAKVNFKFGEQQGTDNAILLMFRMQTLLIVSECNCSFANIFFFNSYLSIISQISKQMILRWLFCFLSSLVFGRKNIDQMWKTCIHFQRNSPRSWKIQRSCNILCLPSLNFKRRMWKSDTMNSKLITKTFYENMQLLRRRIEYSTIKIIIISYAVNCKYVTNELCLHARK